MQTLVESVWSVKPNGGVEYYANGTLTAGLCMHHCLPNGKGTIFMNATHKDISHISSTFSRLER